MPFSTERTNLILAKLRDRLENGTPNAWERSFFTNMLGRFERDGPKTHLSKAQYRKLHELLGLESENGRQNSTNTSNSKPRRSTYRARPPVRSISPLRAIYAPQRAVRRATRQLMLPIILVMGILGLIGALFENSGPSRATFPQGEVRDVAGHLIVTGSSVNQRTGPGTGSPVMGQLAQGTRVKKLGDEGGWTQISSPLGTGWMSSRFLAPPGNAPQQTGGANTTIRTLSSASIRVIDGDTVDIRGQTANVRLVGFNTPEVSSPQCDAELDAGRRATARLKSLLQDAQSIEFERVACACKPGTEGTSRCNYGRQCGKLRVDGTDVGKILISESLAVPYICGNTSCPPRPGNWCR